MKEYKIIKIVNDIWTIKPVDGVGEVRFTPIGYFFPKPKEVGDSVWFNRGIVDHRNLYIYTAADFMYTRPERAVQNGTEEDPTIYIVDRAVGTEIIFSQMSGGIRNTKRATGDTRRKLHSGVRFVFTKLGNGLKYTRSLEVTP